MNDIDDNMLEDFETEPVSPEPVTPSPVSANRPFYIALGVIGAAFLLAIIGMALYAAIILPQRSAARRQQAALINAQNTATSMAATQAESLLLLADTATSIPQPTETLAPSATAVVAIPTETPEPTETPAPVLAADMLARTQTVAVLLTQAAAGGLAGAAVTPTALPSTGFAEEAGVGGLLGIAVLLVVVIFLVRRLRLANSS